MPSLLRPLENGRTRRSRLLVKVGNNNLNIVVIGSDRMTSALDAQVMRRRSARTHSRHRRPFAGLEIIDLAFGSVALDQRFTAEYKDNVGLKQRHAMPSSDQWQFRALKFWVFLLQGVPRLMETSRVLHRDFRIPCISLQGVPRLMENRNFQGIA